MNKGTIQENKEDLLTNIINTKNDLHQLFDIHMKYREVNKLPLNFKWWHHIVLWIILVLSVSYLFDFITGLVIRIFSMNEVSQISDTGFYIFLFVCTIIYIVFYKKYNEYKLNKKLSQNADFLKHADASKEMLLKKIQNESVIPENYHDINTLIKFEEYINNGRADDLKEVINLYESEMQHQEHINQLKMLQELQAMTYTKADQAVTLGWVNLFTKR